MLRCVMLAVVLAGLPTLACAGPKEDAHAVFQRFLTEFTAADIDGVVGTFWPNALLWGNTSSALATTPQEVREYFKLVSTRKPNEMKATSLESSAVEVSDSVVLISGLWQIERMVDGKPVVTASRISTALVKRENEWKMAQFHSSARPAW